MILFRLTIDVSLMKDTIVCSDVERTITTVLEAIPEDGTDDTVCLTLEIESTSY